MVAIYSVHWLISSVLLLLVHQQTTQASTIRNSSKNGSGLGRERLSLNEGWRFLRTIENADNLIYDRRPDLVVENSTTILKPWILPSGNDFIIDTVNHHQRPAGNPGGNFSFVQKAFDDSSWEIVNLPHDCKQHWVFVVHPGHLQFYLMHAVLIHKLPKEEIRFPKHYLLG
jgi:hypothetical protein